MDDGSTLLASLPPSNGKILVNMCANVWNGVLSLLMVSNNLNLGVLGTAGVMFACGLGLSVSMEEESDHVVSARWGLGVCGFAIGLVQCTYMYLHTRGDVHLQVDIHVVHIYTMSNTKWIHTALYTHTQ